MQGASLTPEPLNLQTLRSSARFTETERSRANPKWSRVRARPVLLSGLKPPIHLKLSRLGVKILHRVAPEIGTKHPVHPVCDRHIESWGHLVPAT